MDLFNLTKAKTVLSRRRNQYTFNGTSTPDNANLISSIISPRVIRFGLQGELVRRR